MLYATELIILSDIFGLLFALLLSIVTYKDRQSIKNQIKLSKATKEEVAEATALGIKKYRAVLEQLAKM